MTSITITNPNYCQSCLLEAQTLGYIHPNGLKPYMIGSYRGAGFPVSEKWNVTLFQNKKGRVRAVTNEVTVLNEILAKHWGSLHPTTKTLIQIDDSGIGFPLGGAMVGVTDGQRVETAVVHQSFFQPPHSENQDWLEEYARLGVEVLARFQPSPETHRIEICSGYINSSLARILRTCGYEVRLVAIEGLLQDTLEDVFRAYIRDLIGEDIYYDPKAVKKPEIFNLYERALAFGLQNRQLAKTGWKCF